MNERRWRRWARWLVAATAITLFALAHACASDPPSTVDEVKRRAADAASGGWFSRMIEAFSGKLVEIVVSVVASVATAVAIGVSAVNALYIGLAALGASFAFRPAQVVNNVDTGGGDYNPGGGGMSFLEYVGLGALIWLGVKYLVIPRSARNFWTGLWGLVAKRGRRGESLRRMVSATGAAHTSAASKAAANQADAEAKAIRGRLG